MKRIKSLNILMILALLWTTFGFIIPVKAAGTATIGFGGPSSAGVDDKITITLYISNITDANGGVSSVGGNLTFDSSYLEYVSGTGVEKPYEFQINPDADYIIAGLDTSLKKGITGAEPTTVFTFVFKALKEGETEITMQNMKLTDKNSKMSNTVIPKKITIGPKSTPTPTPTPTPTNPSTPTPPAQKSNDATLKSLGVSGYTLKPGFKSNVNTYSITVKNNITGLDVNAVPNSGKANVEVSGNGNWRVGVNVITIKVTAENGNVNTYTVNVTREAAKTNNTSTPKPKSSDNYLKDLIINSSHEISPKFNKNTSNYSVTVPYEVDKLDLTYVTDDANAKVKVNGNSNFLVGEMNTVEIEVTAEDGTIRVYTLNVTRSTQNGKTDLKELTVTNGTLNPNFDPNTLEYNLKVDGKTDKLDIKAIAKDADSKVEIIGNDNLKEGKNTVLVKVTDKNGFTKYYTINVEKEAKKNTILGLSPLQFGIISGIIGLLLFLLLFLLWKRRKDDDKEEVKEEPAPPAPVTPIIEVKPEFNFSSKNTSDDDIVHGNMNQDSTVTTGSDAIEATRTLPAIEATYEDVEDRVPYDPYDETVTKKELIDAINEATKTKDPAKLKMLLEQDALNQKKKELRKKEEELRRKRDTDNWR